MRGDTAARSGGHGGSRDGASRSPRLVDTSQQAVRRVPGRGRWSPGRAPRSTREWGASGERGTGGTGKLGTAGYGGCRKGGAPVSQGRMLTGETG